MHFLPPRFCTAIVFSCGFLKHNGVLVSERGTTDSLILGCDQNSSAEAYLDYRLTSF